MIGIVNDNADFLNDISNKLGQFLKDSGLCYHAENYADLIEYPDGSKYALTISENKQYYDPIMTTLTQEEKNMIEWIGSDWYTEIK